MNLFSNRYSNILFYIIFLYYVKLVLYIFQDMVSAISYYLFNNDPL